MNNKDLKENWKSIDESLDLISKIYIDRPELEIIIYVGYIDLDGFKTAVYYNVNEKVIKSEYDYVVIDFNRGGGYNSSFLNQNYYESKINQLVKYGRREKRLKKILNNL